MEVPVQSEAQLVELSFEEALSLPRQKLESLASQHKIVLFSRSLNLGSTDEINFDILKSLKRINEILKPVIIHESLSWSTFEGHHSYLELPVPLTEANLELVVERVFRIQECLGRKIALRNLHPYLKFVGAEFNQAEFICEVARITGCDVVLDHSNGDLSDFDILPKDFVKLHRLRDKNGVVLHAADGELTTDRMALEPIPRREVKLEEGVFETEPRRILFEEVTRGFGIRPQADLAVFDPSLSPKDGLAAYNQQYFIQIRNVLHAQYRSVAFLLSGQFDRIIVDYLVQYPPTETLITHAGRDFEYFLRESTLTSNGEMLGDLARLDSAICEVVEEEELRGIDQGVMMEIESGLWDRVIFKLNDQVRLVEANYDVLKIQKTISKGKLPENPKIQKSHFLVYKLNEKPAVQLIGRPEAKALRYAWDEMTFIKICERISQEEGLVLDQVIQQTFSFIHRWAGLGLVKAFEIKAPAEVIGFEGTAWDHDRDFNSEVEL